MRGRLAQDDFVVDDGVGGYMDNGMDDFDEEYESEQEEKRSKGIVLSIPRHIVFPTEMT